MDLRLLCIVLSIEGVILLFSLLDIFVFTIFPLMVDFVTDSFGVMSILGVGLEWG